jgi:hypothetical protein
VRRGPAAGIVLTRHASLAASLGLMDKEDSPSADTAYSNLIQTFNRFVLDTISLEAILPSAAASSRSGQSNVLSPAQGPVSKLFGHSVRTRTTCSSCGVAADRESNSHVVDLIYPRKVRRGDGLPMRRH